MTTITKETQFLTIQMEADGVMYIKLAKAILEDGVPLPDSKTHLLQLTPMSDIQDTVDRNNVHLVSMGYGEIAARDVARINLLCAAEFTPLCVATFRVKVVRQHLEQLERLGDTPENAELVRIARAVVEEEETALVEVQGRG